VICPITFVCYGRHLHGCESGSVDHEHNVPGTPILEVDSARAAGNRSLTFAAPNRRISTFIHFLVAHPVASQRSAVRRESPGHGDRGDRWDAD
jgi:hypothetical protein